MIIRGNGGPSRKVGRGWGWAGDWSLLSQARGLGRWARVARDARALAVGTCDLRGVPYSRGMVMMDDAI